METFEKNGETKKEFVLLACLSTLHPNAKLTEYSYEDSNGEKITVEGYMTNEAPAKVVLSITEKLDRIVVLCSDEVKNAEVTNDQAITKSRESASLNQTHYEYYKNIVIDYSKKLKKNIPDFLPVDISNNPGEDEISKAAIEAAEYILGNEKSETKRDIYLYIDYNGGPRYVASMLLNTANLMEQRGVIIQNILTMNYENKVNGVVPMESFMGVLQSSRLVSGIKEYVDYGRNKELMKYFENYDDTDVKSILGMMTILTYDLQVCDVKEIFGGDNINNLEDKLKDYIEKHKDDMKNKTGDHYSILFYYIANDILEGYKPLFDGDLLDIIDWCREKDYIQQAVVFYAERMPILFWDTGIYMPSDEEMKGYEKIKVACEKFEALLQEKRFNKLKEDEKYSLQEAVLNKIGNILNDTSDETRRSYVDNIIKNFMKYDWKASWLGKYLQFGYKPEYDWIDERVEKPADKTWKDMQVAWMSKKKFDINGKGRTKSFCDDVGKLGTVLQNYWNIKQQRNKISHAAESDERWPYNTMVTNLEEYIKNIRDLLKTKTFEKY